MAVARSDGRNALEGGVIGWRKDSDLPSLAADVVPKLAVNEVSSRIETSSGYHLVTVLDKKGGKEPDHHTVQNPPYSDQAQRGTYTGRGQTEAGRNPKAIRNGEGFWRGG